jgi:3-deoxy-manno-octulosonate cytidylyltransferase (CMP-KDO synthetase)
MADFIVIVPARLASTRLPRKPLADIGGVPMVVRVARNAAASGARRVIVAADSEEIITGCAAHGVESVLTSADHPTGTDRLAEAAGRLGLAPQDIVVNVQGDEPMMPAAVVREAATRVDCEIATAAHPITDAASLIRTSQLPMAGRALAARTDSGHATPLRRPRRVGRPAGAAARGLMHTAAF